MKSRGNLIRATGWVLLMLVGAARPAAATPLVVVDYMESDLGGGQFQYDYVVHNAGTLPDDAGYDVYDLTLFFASSTSLLSVVTPADWGDIPIATYVELFSLVPGASPAGADVGPGQSLGGFTLVFDSAVGDLVFQALLANPGDPENPVVVDGFASEAVSVVPEPGTLLLLGTGVLAVTGRKRCRRGEWLSGPAARLRAKRFGEVSP